MMHLMLYMANDNTLRETVPVDCPKWLKTDGQFHDLLMHTKISDQPLPYVSLHQIWRPYTDGNVDPSLERCRDESDEVKSLSDITSGFGRSSDLASFASAYRAIGDSIHVMYGNAGRDIHMLCNRTLDRVMLSCSLVSRRPN